MTPEGKFQKKVIKDLKALPNCYFYKHQAGSIRGVADIIVCLNGLYGAFELKKDLASTRRSTGRIVLQKHNIEKIKKAGGYACLTCPETWSEDLEAFILKATTIYRDT